MMWGFFELVGLCWNGAGFVPASAMAWPGCSELAVGIARRGGGAIARLGIVGLHHADRGRLGGADGS